MNAFRQWYDGLAPRERVAVVAAAVTLVFAVFYFGLWQPLDDAVVQGRARVTAQSQQARWMLGIRDEARLLQSADSRRSVKGSGDSLLSVVDTTSRANGLGDRVRRIQPDGNNKAMVTLQKANFNQMLYWLRTLRTDYGVSTTQLTVTREDQQGTVQARLTLSRGGA